MNSSPPIVGLDEYESDAELKAVELFVGYPDALLKLLSVCCVIFIIIGVPGNLITIISLIRCKQIRNATAIFIVNLSVADLLFCALIIPMVMCSYWTRSWLHGRVLCRLFPLLNYAFVIVSIYTVVAIATNRYILICHPTRYHTIYTRRNISIIISALWILTFGVLLLPFFEVWGRMSLDPKTGTCTIVPNNDKINPKKSIVGTLVAIALVIILACYIRILLFVKKSIKRATRGAGTIEFDCTTDFYSVTNANHNDSSLSSDDAHAPEVAEETNGRLNNVARLSNKKLKRTATTKKRLPSKKDKKLRTMVYAIMICLFVCYMPISITKLLYKQIETSPTFNVIGYILIYSAPCINPILYVFMSKEYRQAYKSMFNMK